MADSALSGTMLEAAELLGVPGMRLNKGQAVRLVPATNLPPDGNRVRYFASPLDGCWSDGVLRGDEDSILVDQSDVAIGC
jgi:hypothetical protein